MDWTRALVIMAHPDDMEYGGAAAVATWTGSGKHVAYLMATKGEAGIDTMEPAEAERVRMQEQRDSCAVVGVDEVEFLDHPDGVVEYGLPLRRDLAAAIRRYRPELVVAVNHRETYGGTYMNMADHRVVGLATIDAVRDAGNRWVFTDLAERGLERWDGVRYLAVVASPEATHAVDVTGTLELGIESLRRHSAYLEALGDTDPAVFLRQSAQAEGERFGGRPAVSFELLGI